MAGQVKNTVRELLPVISAEVGAVRKGETNRGQGFKFRGIDAVVNAVHPIMARHGVGIVPEVRSVEYENVEVGAKRTVMVSCRIVLAVTFYAGDSEVTTVVAAESMDAGDKATAKAHSVALRTALLQTLLLPTDEADPDHDLYERRKAEPVDPDMSAQILMDRIAEAGSVDELRAVWGPVTELPEAWQGPIKDSILAKRALLEGPS